MSQKTNFKIVRENLEIKKSRRGKQTLPAFGCHVKIIVSRLTFA